MTTLNLSNFKTVFDDDFTKDTSFNTSLWSARWGNANQVNFTDSSAGLLLSGSAAADWNPVGFEQAPTGKSAGEGYGLYSFTGYAGQAGQGVGICFLLWPADNVWLPSDKPGQASEIDLLESDDGTKTGLSTIHYYDASAPGDNGQEFHTITGVNLTQSNTYAIDWEPNALTYYVNGQEIYQDTTHVPLDYANGGVNETMGAEVVNEASYVTTPTVQLYIQNMSYSAPVAAPTMSLSAPGTVQEASVGAGVTVTETVSTTNLTGTIYAAVLTASGTGESYWQAETLGSNGQASFKINLEHTGDYVVAVNNLSDPTIGAISAPVTITDPATSITLSAPGTVQEASAGAGVTVTETVSTTGLTGTIYAAVLTASGSAESYWQPETLGSNGQSSFKINLEHSGDYVVAVNNLNDPTAGAISSPVTITDPVSSGPATVSVAKPATLVAGQDTFTGTVTNGNPTSVEFAWHGSSTGETATAADMVTATKQANGTYSATVTVDHVGQTGYFYVAVNGIVTDEWSAVPVAAASGASATPTFIASTGSSVAAASITGSIQQSASALQSAQGSQIRDLLAKAIGTASSAAIPQPTTAQSGSVLSLTPEQLISAVATSHTTSTHASI